MLNQKFSLLLRAVLYFVLAYWLIPLAFDPVCEHLRGWLHAEPGLTAANLGLQEFENLLVALVCTAVFALYERRRIDSYGLPIRLAFSVRTAEGALVGFVMVFAVAGVMYVSGVMQIHGFAAATATSLVWSAAIWLLANVCVGIAEELWWRSYFLQTLWASLGFWPASFIVAFLFMADHYFFKSGENIWDAISLVMLSLFMSYSVLKTGSLWFAVGFHSAFDFAQLFVVGTPNGSRLPQGRLLDATFNGSAWINGGVLGTEASLLMYPAIILAWAYVAWRFHGVRCEA